MLMKIAKTLVSVFVVTALVGAVYGVRSVKSKTSEPIAALVNAAPKMKGNPAASTRVVEYIDYQCPSCSKSSVFLHELSELHPKDLFIEVKYFPLNGHKHSMTSAKAVE
jgi:protein-disulfide isomerase